jgi:hypothetical protein
MWRGFLCLFATRCDAVGARLEVRKRLARQWPVPFTYEPALRHWITKQFKLALNGFLHSKYFYTLDEYMNQK